MTPDDARTINAGTESPRFQARLALDHFERWQWDLSSLAMALAMTVMLPWAVNDRVVPPWAWYLGGVAMIGWLLWPLLNRWTWVELVIDGDALVVRQGVALRQPSQQRVSHDQIRRIDAILVGTASGRTTYLRIELAPVGARRPEVFELGDGMNLPLARLRELAAELRDLLDVRDDDRAALESGAASALGDPYREAASGFHVRLTFTKLDAGSWGSMGLGALFLVIIVMGLVHGTDRFGSWAAAILAPVSLALVAWPLVARYRWLELEHSGDALEIRQGWGRRARSVRAIPLTRIGVVVPVVVRDRGTEKVLGAALRIVMALRPFEHEAEELQLGGELHVPLERWQEIARKIHEILGTPSVS